MRARASRPNDEKSFVIYSEQASCMILHEYDGTRSVVSLRQGPRPFCLKTLCGASIFLFIGDKKLVLTTLAPMKSTSPLIG